LKAGGIFWDVRILKGGRGGRVEGECMWLSEMMRKNTWEVIARYRVIVLFTLSKGVKKRTPG